MDSETALLAANLAVYVSLVFGLVARRRSAGPAGMGSADLFHQLEASLKTRFPDLPPGFTWREGLARARRLDLRLDWAEIDAAADRYEAFRYGGAKPEPPDTEVIKLVRSLRS